MELAIRRAQRPTGSADGRHGSSGSVQQSISKIRELKEIPGVRCALGPYKW